MDTEGGIGREGGVQGQQGQKRPGDKDNDVAGRDQARRLLCVGRRGLALAAGRGRGGMRRGCRVVGTRRGALGPIGRRARRVTRGFALRLGRFLLPRRQNGRLQLPHALVTLRRVERARPLDNLPPRGAYRRALEAALTVLRLRVASGQAKESEHPKSVYVAAHIGLAKPELLGRRIGLRAEVSRVARRALTPLPRYAEVDKNRRRGVRLRENHVRRRKVAVNNGHVEALMQLYDRVANRGHKQGCERLSVCRTGGADDLAQRGPAHVLHQYLNHIAFIRNAHDARELAKTLAARLGIQQRSIRAADARIRDNQLAHVRAELPPVRNPQVDELSGLGRRDLEDLLHAISARGLRGLGRL